MKTRALPVWKRTLDLACITVASPFVLPVMVCVGLMIRIASPGPVLFRQKRIGYRGQVFTIFKFRSMRVAADTAVHQEHLKELIKSGKPMVKMDNHGDPRLIPFGSILRSTGLDELPQLINVLRGEMSLVGPRPCTPYEYDEYLPWQKERFHSFPGLTGLWQVSGKNKTTFEEMIHMDISYGQRKSPFLDCYIMFKTPLALLGQVLESRGRKKTQLSGRHQEKLSQARSAGKQDLPRVP